MTRKVFNNWYERACNLLEDEREGMADEPIIFHLKNGEELYGTYKTYLDDSISTTCDEEEEVTITHFDRDRHITFGIEIIDYIEW